MSLIETRSDDWRVYASRNHSISRYSSGRGSRTACFAHYALVPALDQPALEAWFALSFGKEHAHGIRETTPVPTLAAPVDPSLEIRRAVLADLDASLELDDIIPRHQSRSPVYSPFR